MSESNSEYNLSTIDSIPLNAESKITNEAVVIAIPITEIRVIKLITFFFFLEERYLFAIKNETLIVKLFF